MEVKKVGEGVYKIENAITKEECEYVYNFIYNKQNNPATDASVVPWDTKNSNILYYMQLTDRRLLDIVNKHRQEMTDTLRSVHNEVIYPHLTTIVLWKPGQSMGRHVDNGAGTNLEENLSTRKYTSVAYMNDDFDGGETFVRNDGKIEPNFRSAPELSYPNNSFTDYISKPQQGAVILFGGDDRNAHGVNKLNSGTRVILSTWFTTDPTKQEITL